LRLSSPVSTTDGSWVHIESLTPSGVTSVNSEAWAGGSYKALNFSG
jgi:hypothetical protein